MYCSGCYHENICDAVMKKNAEKFYCFIPIKLGFDIRSRVKTLKTCMETERSSHLAQAAAIKWANDVLLVLEQQVAITPPIAEPDETELERRVKDYRGNSFEIEEIVRCSDGIIVYFAGAPMPNGYMHTGSVIVTDDRLAEIAKHVLKNSKIGE